MECCDAAEILLEDSLSTFGFVVYMFILVFVSVEGHEGYPKCPILVLSNLSSFLNRQMNRIGGLMISRSL